MRQLLLVLIGALFFMNAQNAFAWESELYGPDWSPTAKLSFDSDKVLQDFSHAGYKRGEVGLPTMKDRPVFNVVEKFSADPTGKTDSTRQIQAAIDAAAQAGGAVVYLPAGTYRVSPQSEQMPCALKVSSDNTLIRGEGTDKTFVLNTQTQMRSKSVVLFEGPKEAGLAFEEKPVTAIREDLPGPTTTIPVESVEGFKVGDQIVLRVDITNDWVREHSEPKWIDANVGSLLYLRKVVQIDEVSRVLYVDAPNRYSMKRRDGARVYVKAAKLSDVGIEDLSIGNLQHPDKSAAGWDMRAFDNPDAKGGYETHASWLIRFSRVTDGWVQNVNSYAPPENKHQAHMLSNGLLLADSHRITVRNCHFQRPQYGGGGGNGYMFRIQNASDNLLDRCIAEFSRHGIVFSHPASSGNVILRCTDRDTKRCVGTTGNMTTAGSLSDHHMRFSHSNLIDGCTVEHSAFAAYYRPGDNHQISAAHTVFWNIQGAKSPNAKKYNLAAIPFVVWTQQARYGYVIGTRGNPNAVNTESRGNPQATDPVDHVEGVGQGETLTPFSLYDDQLKKRLDRMKTSAP